MTPDAAFYSHELGEFVLPDEAVRTARAPDAMLLDFLQSTTMPQPTWPIGIAAGWNGRSMPGAADRSGGFP